MVDFPGALPMYVARNRVFINQNDHTWLVIHKTAGGSSAQAIARFFASDPNMASTHYVIGQDGTIVQCVAEVDGAAGNCCLETGHASYLPVGINLNVKTISIEHVDPATDNSTPLTDAQKAASFRLVQNICQRHNIPMRPGDANGGIIGHKDIAPINRARCPGNYPWSELFQFLNNNHSTSGDELSMLSLTDPIGQHFIEQASGRWHCKETDVDLVYALLSFYRMYGGLLRLPLTNELYLKQYPDTAIQVFEGGIAAYDPKHIIDAPAGAGPVYLLKISEGIGQQIIAKPLLAELQAQVSSLGNQLASAKAEVANKPDVSALETELASAKAAFNSIEAVLAQQKGKVY